MKKKILYVGFSLLFLTFLLVSINNISFAVDVETVIVDAKNPPEVGTFKDIMNKSLGVVQTIAIGVATIMLVVLATKYIASAPNEKAEIKKHAIPYVVGAVLMFAGSGIVEIIKQFAFETINK